MLIGIILATLITSCSTPYFSYPNNKRLYSDVVSSKVNRNDTPPALTTIKDEQWLDRVTNTYLQNNYQNCLKPTSRLTRWRPRNIKDSDTIRKFKDKGEMPYKDLQDDTLWHLQATHDMEGVIDFLKYVVKTGDQDKYFTNLKNGRGIQANASLVLVLKNTDKQEGLSPQEKLYLPRELHPNGRLKIIMNTNTNNPNKITIYHMMFHENTKRPKQRFNGQHPKSNKNKNKNKEMTLIKDKDNGYRILEKKRLEKKENDYVIEYIPPKDSPYKSKRLYIHPICRSKNSYLFTPVAGPLISFDKKPGPIVNR
ncbi:hypothetical protein [Cardinium endosymbiont of Philonthus spinipes]|uniref:hypothetical protein n=1 Tax=Cardinium endosymbiont of Philonthus spinipes TaxID=3077941 RepID=UPI00313CB27E